MTAIRKYASWERDCLRALRSQFVSADGQRACRALFARKGAPWSASRDPLRDFSGGLTFFRKGALQRRKTREC